MTDLPYFLINFLSGVLAGVFVSLILYKLLPEGSIGPGGLVGIGSIVWFFVFVTMMATIEQTCDEICTGETPYCSHGLCVKCDFGSNSCPRTHTCNKNGSCTLAT